VFQLLTLVAMLMVLAGLFLPGVIKLRERAQQQTCANNLRQIGIATHSLNDTFGKLPPAVGEFPKDSKMDGTILFHLLPFVEQTNLYQMGCEAAAGFPIAVYSSPCDRSAEAGHRHEGFATTSYAANALAFTEDAKIPGSFPDGTSNTILFGQRYRMCNGTPNAWGYTGVYYWAPMMGHYSVGRFQTLPQQADCDPALAQGLHEKGIQVVLCDGSFRLLGKKLTDRTWVLALDPDDGQPLGPDW
jgi:hypothetical protein